MLGRVLAFYTLGAMAAAMGGITFFGWVTGRFGVPAAVVAIGLVMGCTGLSAWRFLETCQSGPPSASHRLFEIRHRQSREKSESWNCPCMVLNN